MMYPELTDHCRALVERFRDVPPERQARLRRLATYVRDAERPVRLLTICTHNSRRSHFAQLGLLLAAEYYGFTGLETYSGGTEATAFDARAVAAARRFGFDVTAEAGADTNPVYLVRTETGSTPYRAYSKVYDAPPNPTAHFAAIMVCSQADAGCPLVPGCDLRLPLPYDDPKAADGTPREADTYDERLREICRDMLFALSPVA